MQISCQRFILIVVNFVEKKKRDLKMQSGVPEDSFSVFNDLFFAYEIFPDLVMNYY